MLAYDFVYDNLYLSDYGYAICEFGGSGGNSTAKIGSEITFTMVKTRNGERYSMSNASFDSCLNFTFQICKNPDDYLTQEEMEITEEEYRDLMRWLNRRSFHEMRFIDEEQELSCIYQASFNLAKINIAGRTYGVELTMQTNRPFGYVERSVEIENTGSSDFTEHIIELYSDDICDIYPDIMIVCDADGDIIIKNDEDSPTSFMEIDNCSNGETITISGEALTIVSDDSEHDIANDFNYDFLRIPFDSPLEMQEKSLYIKGNCTVTLNYKQIMKEIL